MKKLSDYVISFVFGLNVRHIFMLPGGGCMHLVDSVGRNGKVDFVGLLHEQAAVIAAEAYAQYNNDVGVALVTTGPGSTNAITGVAAAWIDSTPLMILSGQVKRKDMLAGKGIRQMGIQEVDIVSIVKPITKYAVTVIEPESIRYHLEKAIHIARSGRPGPVWIDIPLDVQGAMIEEGRLKGFDQAGEAQNLEDGKLAGKADDVIELLNGSVRPVILAGRGIRLANAEKEFIRLIRAIDVPVLTTWRMMDIMSDDDELYFGRPGSIASRSANFVLQNSDFMLAIGARLDLAQAGHSYANFARGAKKAIVDVDEAEIKKIDASIDAVVVSDAGMFLAVLLDRLDSVRPKDRSDWISRCREWKARYPVVLHDHLKPGRRVNTYALIEALSNILSGDDVIVPGSSGSCAEITCQAFKVKRGQRVLNSPGLGSMGFGLPQAIGACLASKRRTVGIIGDGGLQHNIQELETLRRLNIPVKLFILNNNGYAAIRNTHKKFFDGRLVCCDPSSGLTLPDTCRVASAYGLKVKRISDQKNLRQGVLDVLHADGPDVCEVMVDPDLQISPKLSSMARPDGTMESRPLEDLWPFLDREELNSNMIIR